MRLIRDFLTLLVLLVGTAISVAAVYQVAQQKLPPPPEEPLDFTEWMTERDLSSASDETSRLLARRLETELRTGAWSGRVNERELDAQQLGRLQDNLLRVLEQYFLDKMHSYFQRPEDKREAYLDRELDKLTRLLERHVPRKLAPSAELLPGALGVIVAVDLEIEEWIARAEPDKQPQMRQFKAAVINQLNKRATDRALEER